MLEDKKKALDLKLMSGGWIRIDTSLCSTCTTQACVRSCRSSTLDPVLKIENGVPVLAREDMKTEKGWCVECLACELDCHRYGKGAVQITFEVN